MSTVRRIIEAKGHKVYSTVADASVFDAVQEMCGRRVGALLVLEDDMPVGILSERDVMTRVILVCRDPGAIRVEEIMTPHLVCIDIDRPIGEAMGVMTECHCRHLPVVDDGEIVGIVSIGDLVSWLSQDQEYEIRILQEYIGGSHPMSVPG